MAADLQELLEQARELSEARPAEAIALLRAVCLPPGGAPADGGDAALKAREAAVTALAALLAKQRDAHALRALLSELRPLFAVIPKAKTAKLVRAVIDAVATVPDTTALQARPPAAARARACVSAGGVQAADARVRACACARFF
jgi:26S proteasome regulatory subunit N6